MSSFFELIAIFLLPALIFADKRFMTLQWYQGSPNFTIPNPLVRLQYGEVIVLECNDIDAIDFRVVSQQNFDECRYTSDDDLLGICKPGSPKIMKRLSKYTVSGPRFVPGTYFIIPTPIQNSTQPSDYYCETIGKVVLKIEPETPKSHQTTPTTAAPKNQPYDEDLTENPQEEKATIAPTNASLEAEPKIVETEDGWGKFNYLQPRLSPDSWEAVDRTNAFTEINHQSLESYLHVIPLLLPLFTLIFPLCW